MKLNENKNRERNKGILHRRFLTNVDQDLVVELEVDHQYERVPMHNRTKRSIE